MRIIAARFPDEAQAQLKQTEVYVLSWPVFFWINLVEAILSAFSVNVFLFNVFYHINASYAVASRLAQHIMLVLTC